MGRRFTPEQLHILKREARNEDELNFVLMADDPVLWSQTYLMDPDEGKYTFECKEQFVDFLQDPSLNRALRVGRQQGKCEAWDTKIQLADGSLKTARDIYNKYGDKVPFELISTNLDNFTHLKTKALIRKNGDRNIYKVTTKSGFETRNTDNHPYLIWPESSPTPIWVEGRHVKSGDRIAVTKDLSICKVPVHLSKTNHLEAELLGYLIGDGGTTQHTIKFTTANIELLNRITYILDKLDTRMKITKSGKYDYNFINKPGSKIPGKKTSWITDFVAKYNLKGVKSSAKRVPEEIFESDNESIVSFISAYWDTDGWVSTSKRGCNEIGACTSSKGLANDIRTLLLRVGIACRLKRKTVKYNGSIRYAWVISICDSRYVDKFRTIMKLNHEEKSIRLKSLKLKPSSSNTDTIPKGIWNYFTTEKPALFSKRRQYSPNVSTLQRISNPDDTFITNICNSNLMWDTVKSCVYDGIDETYAITVPSTENLITDNFITHNTVHLCVDILHLSATRSNATIVVFVPEKKNMNRMLEIMKNLIQGSPIENSFSMGKKIKIKNKVAPQYDYEVSVSSGSVIRFFFMAQKPDKARGQSVTHIYIDEAEYIPEKAWPVITGMVKKDPNIPILAASTPSGLEGTWFREFCDKCSKVGNTRGNEYHIPSTAEKNWAELEVRLKEVIHDEVTWKLEVLAEWAEAKGAVYKKEMIDASIERSKLHGFYLDTEEIRNTQEYKNAVKFLGVDWNNPQNGTRLVELSLIQDKLWLTRHERIAYEKYTQSVAVERILELNRDNKYKMISVDSGYGEVQIELLHQKMNNIDGDIGKILNIIDAGKKEKITIEYGLHDGAIRRTKVDVRVKTKLVGLVTKYLEFQLVIPKDEDEAQRGLVKELRNFKRKESLREGGFVYSENTHSVSALQMCLHGVDKYLSTIKLSNYNSYETMTGTDLKSLIVTAKSVSSAKAVTIITNRASTTTGGSRISGLHNGYQRRTIL